MASEEHVGTVTHYFDQPQVGALDLEATIEVGDLLRFEGHTTDFSQEVTSMEIDHEPVRSAGPGDEVALRVEERVREGDDVYRVTRG